MPRETALENAENYPPSRIVNGNQTEHGQIPFQVLVLSRRLNGQGICGGILISNEYVLTAAHCCVGAHEFEVHLGAQNFHNHNEAGRIIDTTSTVTIHRHYNPFFIENDVALIKLSQKVTFTDKIQAAKFPEADDLFVDRRAIVSGWGLEHTHNADISSELQYAELVVITQARCERVFGRNIVHESTICAEGEQGQSACKGDSGGPLVLESDRLTLIGVVSFGHVAGCHHSLPQGFSRITKFMHWISQNTGIVF